jgi:hypothetical protein
MWYGIKLVEFKFVVRANIDVGTFVFSTIAILGCGENCSKVSAEGVRSKVEAYL